MCLFFKLFFEANQPSSDQTQHPPAPFLQRTGAGVAQPAVSARPCTCGDTRWLRLQPPALLSPPLLAPSVPSPSVNFLSTQSCAAHQLKWLLANCLSMSLINPAVNIAVTRWQAGPSINSTRQGVALGDSCRTACPRLSLKENV